MPTETGVTTWTTTRLQLISALRDRTVLASRPLLTGDEALAAIADAILACLPEAGGGPEKALAVAERTITDRDDRIADLTAALAAVNAKWQDARTTLAAVAAHARSGSVSAAGLQEILAAVPSGLRVAARDSRVRELEAELAGLRDPGSVAVSREDLELAVNAITRGDWTSLTDDEDAAFRRLTTVALTPAERPESHQGATGGSLPVSADAGTGSGDRGAAP